MEFNIIIIAIRFETILTPLPYLFLLLFLGIFYSLIREYNLLYKLDVIVYYTLLMFVIVGLASLRLVGNYFLCVYTPQAKKKILITRQFQKITD